MRALSRHCLIFVAALAAATRAEAGERAVETAPDAVVVAAVKPDLFGTVALPASAGRWTADWQRVASNVDPSPALRAFVAPMAGVTKVEALRRLQAAVDRSIGWRSDGTQYGRRTYWATASETLASGRGDDNDRAILKYQALRLLGFAPSDLYLVMGRDRIRGEHMVLAARIGREWWVLDEQGDSPVPASQRGGFEPVASFGANRSYIHGRPRSTASTLSASASSFAAGRP